LFYSASGVSQRWEFKTTTTNVLQKSCVEKFFKKIDQKSKTDFFSNLFSHVFGRFSMRGAKKHDLKNVEKINLTLVLFRTLTHQPITGVTDFVFGGPFLFCFLV
jgi:hypothetical protein